MSFDRLKDALSQQAFIVFEIKVDEDRNAVT
jgi:hypothetical protein